MKVCSTCHVEQRIENFYPKDSRCKVCRCAYVKAYRQANRERLRRYDRQRNALPHRVMERQQRAKTEKGKRSMRKRREKFVETHPLKRSAHLSVRYALVRGELRREPCEFIDPQTGDRCYCKNTEGHHEDYSKPLEVTWLCKKHHDRRHVILREQERTGTLIPWRVAKTWDEGLVPAPF